MGRDQLEKEMEEEAGFHGIVNIKEARLHARALDEVMKTIQTKVEKEDTKDVAEMAIQQILEETCPMIKDASIKLVLEAIKDPKFMVLQLWLDETEQMMEEITPLEELPQGLDVIRNIDDLDPLTESQKTLLGELFDALEVTHEHLAQACSMLGTLSRTLKSNLLLLVLKASICPMIQMNVVPGLLRPLTTRRKLELPDNQTEWVKLMMTLDPASKSLKQEKVNSPTHLLAVTFAFKILNKFGNGTMQRKMQESYKVCLKQLVAV